MNMTTTTFRLGLGALALTALSACQPPVPDSGAGVGFGDYTQYQRQREAQLSGQAASSLPPASAVSSETLEPTGAGTTAVTPLSCLSVSKCQVNMTHETNPHIKSVIPPTMPPAINRFIMTRSISTVFTLNRVECPF